jgi:hypothetical protein
VASDLSSKESIHRLCQIGLTDATLLHIAMEKGYVILSDDRRLRDAGLGYVRLLDSLLSEKQD